MFTLPYKRHALCVGALAAVSILSFFTHFWPLGQPARPVFDEHYYITDAQRYLHGVFFMKHNPPLGKLLSAAGEALLQKNERSDHFLTIENANAFPNNFDFTGYRLFPVLLLWLTAPLLFLILFAITRSVALALPLTLPFIFDNHFITLGRSAMLEGPLLFFTALSVLVFLYQPQKEAGKWRIIAWAGLLGCAIGLALSVKFMALVLLALPAAAIIRRAEIWKNTTLILPAFLMSMLITTASIWQIHFSIARQWLPDVPSTVGASEQYREILQQGKTLSVLSFPIMLRDSLNYAETYNRQLPSLAESRDLGSPVYSWPLGWKPIPMLMTHEGSSHRRILVATPNFIAWWGGLLGVLYCAVIALKHARKNGIREVWNQYSLMLTLLIIYTGYMLAMSQVRRILFVYHYAIPLICSFILLGIAVTDIQQRYGQRYGRALFAIGGLALLLLFLMYEYLYPVTYYQPIPAGDIRLKLWDL